MASFKYNNVYINDSFTVAGPLEADGQIHKFDLVMNDYYYKEKTFLDAEIKMQKTVIDNLLYRNKLKGQIDLLIGGDLSNQLSITSHCAVNFDIPYLGVYSACASFLEGMIIAANMIDTKRIRNSLVITSSHNLNSERQFRFPIEYGAPRALTTTFTATGSVGIIMSGIPSKFKLESATIGKAVDYNMKDATHMGAVMAPAAALTLQNHLQELKRDVDYYDVIITGDLGEIGSKIFKEFLKTSFNIKLKNHIDCGGEIFVKSQEVYSGSSGPVTLPLVVFNKILKNNRYKKILLIATGSLHSKDTTNQKKAIPSIAHALSLEVI